MILATLLAGTTAMATAGVAAAAAAPAHVSKSAHVVLKRHRAHFGKILVTDKGAALYTVAHGSCTGGCLSVWPRLVMPKGKTIPKGAGCLGTARFGRHHRLQVTYHGKRLYTFVDDSGHSVSGNGVEGFKVAKVVACTTM